MMRLMRYRLYAALMFLPHGHADSRLFDAASCAAEIYALATMRAMRGAMRGAP